MTLDVTGFQLVVQFYNSNKKTKLLSLQNISIKSDTAILLNCHTGTDI